jgi:hypothetical protein
MWTHFHPESRTLFSTTLCETCGASIEAPNAVTGHDPTDHYRRMRIKIVERRFAAGFYDEDTGRERCELCPPKGGDA